MTLILRWSQHTHTHTLRTRHAVRLYRNQHIFGWIIIQLTKKKDYANVDGELKRMNRREKREQNIGQVDIQNGL